MTNTEKTQLPDHVASPSPSAISNAGMKPNMGIGALVPQSLDDAFRLAKALAMSGDMIPKHFQGKPEMTMAAILRGMEIGLSPMQALSQIAVINGRSSVWGDALPALMQRSGHRLDSYVEGEGDEMIATATLIRGDTGQKIVRTFSAIDAKAAGLLGKQGPWQQYRKRMMQMRARAWACRDGAADALMGMQVAEETSDYQPIKDVTPRDEAKGGFSKMIAKAREETPEPDQSETLGDDQESEQESSEEADEDLEIDPEHPAFKLGFDAAAADLGAGECPFREDPDSARHWLAGWEAHPVPDQEGEGE
jgi:hypothetical protein